MFLNENESDEFWLIQKRQAHFHIFMALATVYLLCF